MDLDCADFNENPVIGGFATQLVGQIFSQFDNRVQDGAIRLGIVGFHSELEIAMNLFELSTIDGRASAQADAIKARVPNVAKFSLVLVSSISGYSQKFSVVVAIFSG